MSTEKNFPPKDLIKASKSLVDWVPQAAVPVSSILPPIGNVVRTFSRLLLDGWLFSDQYLKCSSISASGEEICVIAFRNFRNFKNVRIHIIKAREKNGTPANFILSLE